MSGRRLAVGGSAVLLAALVVSVGSVVKYIAHEPVPRPTARPSTSAVSSPPRPPADPPTAPARPADLFPVDDRGFVDSRARCDDGQTAVAIGRTPGSLVVICGDHDGRYGYRGVRLSDDAVLTTAARSTPTHEFVAKNASVTYAISRTELRVTVGGAVIKREPMLDYRVR